MDLENLRMNYLQRPQTDFLEWLMEFEEKEKFSVVYCPKRDEIYLVETFISVMNGNEYYVYGNGVDKLFGTWKQTKFCSHWEALGYL